MTTLDDGMRSSCSHERRRRLTPRSGWSTWIIGASAVALTSCGASSSAKESPTAPLKPSSTIAHTTATSASSASSTTTASVPPGTSASTSILGSIAPRTVTETYEDQTVSVTVDPGGGSPGTEVSVTGSGFVGQAGQSARNHAYYFALISDSVVKNCELISEGDRPGPQSDNPSITVSPEGHLTGSFTVPHSGACFQQNGTDQPLAPGLYNISLGSHADYIDQFQVTT